MDPRYTNREDVSRRLNDSIVKFKDTFYYATSDRERDTLELTLFGLDSGKPVHKVDANSPDLDISSPELGYCHCHGPETAVFIRRAPYRRQKQGVSNENLTYTLHKEGTRRGLGNDLVINKYFKEMLDGKYKPYSDCLAYFNDEKNKDKTSCLAFSRDFAIGKETSKGPLILYYQNVRIGEILKGKAGVYHSTNLDAMYNNSIFIQFLSKHGAMNA